MAWSGGTFTRSNGTYTGATVWSDDDTNGFAIESTRHDTHDQDLATGINTCIAKDGQNTPSANLPMGGFLHTNVAAATARTHYGRMAEISDSSYMWGGTAGGSGGNYTASITPAPSAYVAGMTIRFIPNHVNPTGNATLNLNSLGAKDILLDNGSNYIPGGFFSSSVVYQLTYSGTVWYLSSAPARRAQAWVPSYGTQAGSFGTITTNFARWCNLGGSEFSIKISAIGTLSSASSNYLTFTLPYSTDNIGGDQYVPCYTFNGATEPVGFFLLVNNSTEVRVYRSASAQWTTGASRGFYGNFIAELK